jgi:hypothetical protein
MNIADAMPVELARARELLAGYKAIGPAGSFGAAMIEMEIRKADEAVASGDAVAIIAAYKALKELE